MGEAFELVWSDPLPAGLDALREALQSVLGGVTPGNTTALGALLLSADDPEDNAPYSTSRAQEWFQLTGYEGTASGPPTAAVRTLLAFLDEFVDRVATTVWAPASRLEAQGMAWTCHRGGGPEWMES